MPDRLENLFSKLAAEVPTEPESEFDFTADLLPPPPEHLETDKLFINKHAYRYGGYHLVDSLWFHASYDTYRHLALLILSSMFYPHEAPVRLDLTHPASDIKHIMFEYNFPDWGWWGVYYARPHRVHYYATHYKDFSAPAGLRALPMEDRLSFRLTNLEDDVYTEEEYRNRNAIWLAGNDRSYALFATYLLNIGRADETEGMYRIEGTGDEGTYLGLWSSEVRFILPGHTDWREDQWVGKAEVTPDSSS